MGTKKRRGSGSQGGGSPQSQAVESRMLPTPKLLTDHSQRSSPPAAPCVPIPGASHTAELNPELTHQRTKVGKKQHTSTQPSSNEWLRTNALVFCNPQQALCSCTRSKAEASELSPSCDYSSQAPLLLPGKALFFPPHQSSLLPLPCWCLHLEQQLLCLPLHTDSICPI